MFRVEDATWVTPPHEPTLLAGEVHIFRLALDVSKSIFEGLRRVLSNEERLRADRFVFNEDRTRFAVCRATLRIILSRYLRVAPTAIEFRYGVFGKPVLEGGIPIHFNVSHSAGLALVAVAWRREVGIDLEQIVPENACSEIASRFFLLTETAAMVRLTPAQRLTGFFQCWTRNEAYVKAHGNGLSALSVGTDLLPQVASGDFMPAQLAAEKTIWTLADIAVGPGFAAALAVEGAVKKIRYFEWQC